MGTNTDLYRSARDQLVDVITDYDKAVATFEWPRLTGAFNWAIDWFDVIARDNDRAALWIVEQDGSEQKVTFDEMADRSDRVGHLAARARRRQGRPGHPDARQPGRTVGVDAGGGQARGDHPADHPALGAEDLADRISAAARRAS